MIEATNLVNDYGRHAAIADSSFSVNPVVGACSTSPVWARSPIAAVAA
jgi:hypothetical protein